jgi:stress response protein SCP2
MRRQVSIIRQQRPGDGRGDDDAVATTLLKMPGFIHELVCIAL